MTPNTLPDDDRHMAVKRLVVAGIAIFEPLLRPEERLEAMAEMEAAFRPLIDVYFDRLAREDDRLYLRANPPPGGPRPHPER